MKFVACFGLVVTLLCVWRSSAMMVNDVTIAGGGLAGLSTAVALHRFEVTDSIKILEASTKEEFENEYAGAAVQLTPNGLKALEILAGKPVLQEVLEKSSKVQDNAMILPSQETLYDSLQVFPSEPEDELPTVMVRWGLLRKILAEQIQDKASTVFGQKVVSYDKEEMSLGVETNGSPSAMDMSSPSTLVVAADGQRSIFRSSPLIPTKRVNLKAVVRTGDNDIPLPNAASRTYSFFTPTGAACFVGPAGNGWSYWAISVTCSDEDLEFYRANACVDQQAAKTKLLQTLKAANLQETLVFTDLVEKTHADDILVQPSGEAELPDRLEDGKIVLVGDAAHAMTASYGQAVSFAMEDSVVLAHCLATGRGLSAYSDIRRDRCEQMQAKSQERATKAMKGESTDDITRWINSFSLEEAQVEA